MTTSIAAQTKAFVEWIKQLGLLLETGANLWISASRNTIADFEPISYRNAVLDLTKVLSVLPRSSANLFQVWEQRSSTHLNHLHYYALILPRSSANLFLVWEQRSSTHLNNLHYYARYSFATLIALFFQTPLITPLLESPFKTLPIPLLELPIESQYGQVLPLPCADAFSTVCNISHSVVFTDFFAVVCARFSVLPAPKVVSIPLSPLLPSLFLPIA